MPVGGARASQSGSSFYYAFRLLPADRRRAITAFYAFCREVDNIVDEVSDVDVALSKLAYWRREIDNLYAGQPQHPVTITAPFAVGRTEVTFAEWLACVADGGCRGYRPPHEGWGGGSRPVINVNWNDANAYVDWLAHKTGKPYRLPTEAEWEYATRAGTTTRYWWGDEIGHDRANCKTCGSQWDEQQTAPTDSFAANAFGLFDVAGNVWEWVEDCWQDDYTRTSPEGVPPSTRRGCSKRTLRGGSWDNSPEQLRSAARIWGRPDGRDNSIGFRVALSLPANAE